MSNESVEVITVTQARLVLSEKRGELTSGFMVVQDEAEVVSMESD